MGPSHRHQCLIYEGSPSNKLPMLAAIIQRKLEEGYRCLYLNSITMVAGMGSTLASIGVDVTSEILNARLVMSSEPVAVQGNFNVELMLRQLEDAVDQALTDGYKGLWASGDMTWEFGQESDFSKLLEYELKLEELINRRSELCGICQYHQNTLPQDAMRQGLIAHPEIVINNTLTKINPHYLKTVWPADFQTTQQLDQTIATLCSI